jgi:hypothetical protein
LPSDVTLRFVVIASSSIASDDIPQSFANANTDEAALKALQDAKAIMLGTIQAKEIVNACAKLPDSYRTYVSYLFDDSRKTVVCRVIKSMEIVIYNSTYDQDLIDKFGNQPIPPECQDILLTYMLGWVHQKVHELTKNHNPAYIAAAEFRAALRAQNRAIDLNKILSTVSTKPTQEAADNEVERLDTYIKQLQLIEVDQTDLFEAASDFLMMKKEKIEWADRGWVTEHSFEDYNDSLCRTWKDQKTIIACNCKDPISDGKMLYAQCRLDSRKQKLQGCETPPFFGNGSLQGLANDPEDSPRIGWHQQYIDLLRKGKQ